MSYKAEPCKQYFYVELTAGPAIVLMDQERPLRSSTTTARIDAGNYFSTLEAAQAFADLINQMLTGGVPVRMLD